MCVCVCVVSDYFRDILVSHWVTCKLNKINFPLHRKLTEKKQTLIEKLRDEANNLNKPPNPSSVNEDRFSKVMKLLFHNWKSLSTLSATIPAMANDDVAAGEGALRT